MLCEEAAEAQEGERMKPYFEQDGCTIYHGDCRDILPQLPKVDLVLTDPPYGLCWSGGTWARAGKYADAARWDRVVSDETLGIVVGSAIDAIIWGGNHYTMNPCRGLLAWFKTSACRTMSDFELAWTTFDRPAKAWTHHNNINNGATHPTQKPVPLMKWCVEQAGDAAQTILDPFMGSGTTLVAARDMGRKAIGIEIEERYCEIAANRLKQGVLFR